MWHYQQLALDLPQHRHALQGHLHCGEGSGLAQGAFAVCLYSLHIHRGTCDTAHLPTHPPEQRIRSLFLVWRSVQSAPLSSDHSCAHESLTTSIASDFDSAHPCVCRGMGRCTAPSLACALCLSLRLRAPRLAARAQPTSPPAACGTICGPVRQWRQQTSLITASQVRFLHCSTELWTSAAHDRTSHAAYTACRRLFGWLCGRERGGQCGTVQCLRWFNCPGSWAVPGMSRECRCHLGIQPVLLWPEVWERQTLLHLFTWLQARYMDGCFEMAQTDGWGLGDGGSLGWYITDADRRGLSGIVCP